MRAWYRNGTADVVRSDDRSDTLRVGTSGSAGIVHDRSLWVWDAIASHYP